jgi:hypothetical protein
MLRAICVTTVLVTATTAALLGQGRDRDRTFGRTAAMTCDEVRRDDRGNRAFGCEIREETLSGSTLDVDASPNGSIRVRGWDRGETLVRARIVTYARSTRSLASEVRVTTSGGRIRADGPRNDRDESWSVSFDLQVPRDAQLTLNALNGGISIYDFRGSARFQTRNGGVSLSQVGGDIRGDTVNGGVNVDLIGDRWEGAGLDVETRNGGVRMFVPANYSAQLETGTVNGGLNIDFPVTVQGLITGRRNRQISTTLGSGGPTIRAVTTNGGVTISRR